MATIETRGNRVFLGMDNRRPEYDLSTRDGGFLRNAVNVDLTDSGSIRRRKGVEKVIAGTDSHSLWSDGGFAFYVDGDTMYRISEAGDTLARETAATGLSVGKQVSYALHGDRVYWTDGASLNVIVDGVSYPAAVPTPNPEPIVAASTDGNLPKGVYQIALTWESNATGLESGASWPVMIELEQDGRINITGLQTPSGHSVNIYMTTAGGHSFHRIANLPSSAISYTVPTQPWAGSPLETTGMVPMPAGDIVRVFNGRLLVASGSTLFMSEPYRLGLYNFAQGVIPFDRDITLLEPCGGSGVFVGTDKEVMFMLGADAAESTLRPVLNYGAVPRTSCVDVPTKTVWWYTSRGIVQGTPDGQVRNVQEGRVGTGPAAVGASLFREEDGMRQVVTTLFGHEAGRAAARSFMDAEVIRREG